MRVLLCNLDPGWEFDTLVHNHCLDVLANEDFHCWNVGTFHETKDDPWGNWPRRIDRRYLGAEITETLQLFGHGDNLFVFHLPAQAIANLRQELDSLDHVLAAKRSGDTHILTLPQNFNSNGLHDLVKNTWVNHVVLLNEDPRLRLYELRMLIAMFQDETLYTSLQKVKDRRVVIMELGAGHTADKPYDAVMQYWPALENRLLDHCDEMRKRQGDNSEWEHVFGTAFKDLENLQDKVPTLEESPVTESFAFLCPWFFSKGLPLRLKKEVDAFYRQLDDDLEKHYAHLNEEHQRWRQEQIDREEPGLLAKLKKQTALTLGFGEIVQSSLKKQQDRLDDERRKIITEEQAVLKSMRGALTLETRRGVDIYGGVNRNYHRPLFREDEDLKNYLRKAQEKAARLASREWFWKGLAVVLLLALIPAVALRAFVWNTVGFTPYFNDPGLWLPDLAWLSLFGCCYLGFGFLQISRRRRELRRAIDNLKDQADRVRERHFKALKDSFRYQYLVMAMRRLVLLGEQIERLTREIQSALNDLSLLEGVLSNQREQYQRLGAGAIADPTLAQTFEQLKKRLRDKPPAEWIPLTLRNWPVVPLQEVDIRDQGFGASGQLKTSYLRDCAFIDINEKTRD
jgi:hypothetical protein